MVQSLNITRKSVLTLCVCVCVATIIRCKLQVHCTSQVVVSSECTLIVETAVLASAVHPTPYYKNTVHFYSIQLQ